MIEDINNWEDDTCNTNTLQIIVYTSMQIIIPKTIKGRIDMIRFTTHIATASCLLAHTTISTIYENKHANCQTNPTHKQTSANSLSHRYDS